MTNNNYTQRLLLEKQIERLDREWTIEREKYRIHGEHSSSLPTNTGKTIGGAIAALVVGVVFCLFFLNLPGPGREDSEGLHFLFTLFPIVLIIALLFKVFGSISKANGYATDEEKYRAERRKLVEELERLG